MSYGLPQQDDMGDGNQMDLVPRWFEMLKELRNGTISYIQLIKREQIRPPVRPVCRRLGVAKLSDIVSEEILYRAIVQVAEAQGRSPRRFVEEHSGRIMMQSTLLVWLLNVCGTKLRKIRE